MKINASSIVYFLLQSVVLHKLMGHNLMRLSKQEYDKRS